MFISMPIKNFKLEENRVFINNTSVEYEPISKENREILESLISKGAYGSALLTLNKFYNVKSINESKLTQDKYLKYLTECNNLMKECIYETKAHNFRPLINLNGLEIMENASHIARGKGNILLIEDFRMTEEYDNGMWMKYQKQIEDIMESAKANMDEDAFLDFCDAVGDIAKQYEFGYNEDETFEESAKLNEVYRESSYFPIELRYDLIDEVKKAARRYKKSLIGMKKESISEAINNALDYTRDFFNDEKELDSLIKYYVNESECEGTQCSDIAEKKDQEVGSLQKPSKPKKKFVEMFNIPKNHGFKGFRLNKQGIYTRGNYILINENGNVKAVKKARAIDDYGRVLWDYDQVVKEQGPRLVKELNDTFNYNGEFDIYDFDFRVEDEMLKVFDKNEEFDFSYLDNDYERANKILQDLFGHKCYFEAEISCIGICAGMRVVELNN